MKRRRRFGVRPLAVLSLLVCLATAVLWVRSYRTMDELFLIYKGDGSEELSCLRGEFRFKHTLPQSGKRDWLARMRHRENRIVALPPRPWAEDRLSRTWRIFRYDDSVYDVKRVAQARAAVQSFWNSRIQPSPAASARNAERRQAPRVRRPDEVSWLPAGPRRGQSAAPPRLCPLTRQNLPIVDINYRSDLRHADWGEMKAAVAADNFENGRTPEELRRSFQNASWLSQSP